MLTAIFLLRDFFYSPFSCRALSEDEPKAKSELSANGTRPLNETERSEGQI